MREKGSVLDIPGARQAEVAVRIDYTNYRGERGVRLIQPERIWFGATEWHPSPQWLLEAYDLEKSASRTFAMLDIHSWQPASDVADS